MTLTKHARDRYIERLGFQEDKEIIRRATQARVVSKDVKANTERRVWGNIQFFLISGDSPVITTITTAK